MLTCCVAWSLSGAQGPWPHSEGPSSGSTYGFLSLGQPRIPQVVLLQIDLIVTAARTSQGLQDAGTRVQGACGPGQP